jgi:hypothetical protein
VHSVSHNTCKEMEADVDAEHTPHAFRATRWWTELSRIRNQSEA